MRFIEVDSYNEMSRAAANIISAQIISKPDSVIGLATGSTPIGAYSQLIEWNKKGDLDFSEVRSVNLDEYYGLSSEHEQSYRYFMNTHLFDHVNIKKENTFVPNGLSEDPEKEGKEYDERIEKFGGIDLQLLGIDQDALSYSDRREALNPDDLIHLACADADQSGSFRNAQGQLFLFDGCYHVFNLLSWSVAFLPPVYVAFFG